jgi:hypothetical protein
MGLPVRQRRTLDRIECALRGSDPKLVSLYAIFARLHGHEEIPRLEQLRHGIVVGMARLRARTAYILGRIFGRILPRQRAVLFFPLTLILVGVSIFFAARSGPGRGCPPVSLTASTHQSSSKACKNDGLNPFGFQH